MEPQATAAIVWLFPLAAILPQILWGVLMISSWYPRSTARESEDGD
jgi:hypothetical protein